MTTLKILLRSIIILISNFTFSQVSESQKINEKNILKIFKSTIDQDKRNRISVTANPWSTESENYLKSDTVKFINPSNKIDENYCHLINWTFYRKNKFIRSYGEYCNEPANEKVTNENDYFELKINETIHGTFLELYNKNKIVENFQIISIEKKQSLSYKNEIQYILTLKRKNKKSGSR